MVSNWEPAHSLDEDASLWGRDWSSPFPSGSDCHIPASLLWQGEGPECSQLILLLYSLSPLFCEGTNRRVRAFCRQFSLSLSLSIFFFFPSMAIPQFGLLSHVSSFRLSSGHSGPVITLRTDDAGCASLSSPCSLAANKSLWATSPLAVAVRRLFCVCVCVCVCVFSVPVFALWDSKTPHKPTCERVSYCFETSPPSRLPPQVWSLPLTLLSPFLFFIVCPTSFWREWAELLGTWCPPPAFRSCFVEVAQHSNDFLMNSQGRKWSPHPIPLSFWDYPANYILMKLTKITLFFFYMQPHFSNNITDTQIQTHTNRIQKLLLNKLKFYFSVFDKSVLCSIFLKINNIH